MSGKKTDKPRFAFYWAASCGGCEIAVLDIDEKILDVAAGAEILFWPVAMDIKYSDVESMKDKYIDFLIIVKRFYVNQSVLSG